MKTRLISLRRTNVFKYRDYINTHTMNTFPFQIRSFSNQNALISQKFKLDDEFINNYKERTVNFGFNGLGELVYRRTYSRVKEDGSNEQWWETVRRVVEGTFNMLIEHLNENNIKVRSEYKKEIMRDSRIMYDKIFNFKFLPPGRGLWSMGTNITEKKKIFAALNNCAFVSTKPVDRFRVQDIIKPYCFLMDCAMLGVGVGFDTKAAHLNLKIYSRNKDLKLVHEVQDSREGWVDSLRVLLNSFFSQGEPVVVFDYSKLRPEGVPLKIFGGISAGPKPLMDLHENITKILESNSEKPLSTRIIVDIMNFIGRSVVAGNISKFS
jgi:ribonucleoside-triphosphate reductase